MKRFSVGVQARREEPREAELVAERSFESRFQDRQDWSALAGQKPYGGVGKQQVGNDCRAGIARQTEDRLAQRDAEGRGLAGLNANPLKQEMRAKLRQNRLHQIVLAGRNAAGYKQQIEIGNPAFEGPAK